MTNAQIGFFAGIAAAGAAGLTAALYLQARLKDVLVDLCGTAPRAEFWLAVTNAALVLFPVTCALIAAPELGLDPVTGGLATELKWALMGLLAALGICAKAVFAFIPRPTGPDGRPL